MRLFVVAAGWWGPLASLDLFDLVLQAGLVVKLVLIVLLGFSLVSWAIIAYKWRDLRRAEQDSEAFLEVYHEGSMEAAYEAARDLGSSPLSSIFLEGYAERNRIAKYLGGRRATRLGETQLRALRRHIDWTASREGLRLERGLSFLATTGSATPFIGLFGTVVGIINAFTGIGASGSASLAVVAPGIAEALIATGVGLFAAIPATIAYNHFVGELRRVSVASDLFTAEFQEDLEAEGVAGTAEAAGA